VTEIDIHDCKQPPISGKTQQYEPIFVERMPRIAQNAA
jgi:hypothetical protein